MDDPIDDIMRKLKAWTPPTGTTLVDLELDLRATYGTRKHYIRSAHAPDHYVIRADRDPTRHK